MRSVNINIAAVLASTVLLFDSDQGFVDAIIYCQDHKRSCEVEPREYAPLHPYMMPKWYNTPRPEKPKSEAER